LKTKEGKGHPTFPLSTTCREYEEPPLPRRATSEGPGAVPSPCPAPLVGPGRLGRSGALQTRFRLLRQLAEPGLVGDGNVGQHLAVNLDTCLGKAIHEAAVG